MADTSRSNASHPMAGRFELETMPRRQNKAVSINSDLESGSENGHPGRNPSRPSSILLDTEATPPSDQVAIQNVQDDTERRGHHTNSNGLIHTGIDQNGMPENSERDLEEPSAELTEFDIAALILNKQIGTGIFTTPGAVLFSTQSKKLSIALWTVGGFWTLIFLLIYLEFGVAFPFNGGELVYLDEIYHKPELLATILFSVFFLLLANSYGNATQFAKNVLLANSPDLDDSTQLDPRLVRFIAISAVTFVCLVLWHSRRAGLFLNKLIAWYKIVLLVVFFIVGMVKSRGGNSKWGDGGPPGSTTDGMTGMVLIFYSYQGWENANYVAGEIRGNRHTTKKTLIYGAIMGTTVTWILYVFATLAIYHVLGYGDLTGPHSDLAVALKFAPRVFGGATGMKICMAISALGNVLAVTYTASKVKQSIAIQGILPFSDFLSKDNLTPKGALVLHWTTSVIFIAAAPTSSDGYSFAVGFYTYGHILFSVFVAIGLFRLQDRKYREGHPWQYTFFKSKPLLYSVPVVFAFGNVLILVFAGKTQKAGQIPRWWWLAVTVIALGIGALYWVVGWMLRENDAKNERKSFGEKIGLSVCISTYENSRSRATADAIMARRREVQREEMVARLDGSQRKVKIKTSGWLRRFVNGFGPRWKWAKENFF